MKKPLLNQEGESLQQLQIQPIHQDTTFASLVYY